MASNVSPLRGLNALDAYGAKARGVAASRPDLGAYSPCVQIASTFALQSYFDSTAYEKAILTQRPNELIVSSTKDDPDIAGYALALHPSSETPVAVSFKGAQNGDSSGASAVAILKPGEVLRPAEGRFSGFSWGLPFGWLGGGLANLLVFTTPKADVYWNTDSREVLFHRLRLPILAPASVPAVASGRVNWPVRFPWTNAYNTSTNAPQFGKPAISVNPTKVQLIVRLSAVTGVTAPPTFRFLLAQFDSFSLTSTGSLNTTIGFFDAVVPSYSNPVGMAAQTVNYPVFEYTSGALLGGGDSAVVTLMDMDEAGADDLAGVEVDILRYGRL